jgi:hypothetical protein
MRLEVFDKLLAENSPPDELGRLVGLAARLPEKRLLPRLWDLAARGDLPEEAASEVLSALQAQYLLQGMAHFARHGSARYGADGAQTPEESREIAAAKKEAAEAGKVRARSGPELQRLVALALLLAADPAQAGEAARQVVEDPSATPALRRDALAVLLASRGAEARTAARDYLSHADPGIRNLALATLALGRDEPPYQYIREHKMYLNLPEGAIDYRGFNHGELKPIVPEAPKGLQPAVLRPLLKDPDPASAAYAGYLLAVLGEADGLGPLVRHWREGGGKDYSLTRLVYRAITALGGDANVPLLEEIFRNLSADGPSNVRDFYWTIRILDGPNALRLRKQIRQTVGMENLQ